MPAIPTGGGYAPQPSPAARHGHFLGRRWNTAGSSIEVPAAIAGHRDCSRMFICEVLIVTVT